jgi:uncharacterized membrane protein YqjE
MRPMRLLWSLPKAAPALLRHMAAYVELVAYDVAQLQRDIVASVVAALIVTLSLGFAIVMGCAMVVAVTWNTPHRIAAIAWMGVAFLVIAVIALLYRAKILKEQTPALESLRRQWKEDEAVLERILPQEERS